MRQGSSTTPEVGYKRAHYALGLNTSLQEKLTLLPAARFWLQNSIQYRGTDGPDPAKLDEAIKH